MKPLVGMTCYAPERVQWGVWDVPAALIPMVYVDAISRAGGRPLIVPPAEDAVEETLEALDGILFSGGEDVAPHEYGAAPHPETRGVDERRDRAELALLRAALERDMPVLAICRGSQLLNVARGGDLVQHLPDVVGDDKHKHTPGVFADHDVVLEPASRLAAVLGDRAPVKSHHHQGYGRIGAGLDVAARAEDGIAEALEDPQRRFAIGVLWHPEEGEDAALFEAFVAEARRYRSERLGVRIAAPGDAGAPHLQAPSGVAESAAWTT